MSFHVFWGHDNSYTRHFVHMTSRTKTKTRHFVQKRNQTFRTKTKPDISCNLNYTTYYYNVVSYVHISLVPKCRSEAWPQCCYLAKGAKRPSHTTYMLTSLIDILAVTALKASSSVVSDLFCKSVQFNFVRNVFCTKCLLYEMSGFIFVPIVRVRNVGFLANVRNVVCTNCRGAMFFDAN